LQKESLGLPKESLGLPKESLGFSDLKFFGFLFSYIMWIEAGTLVKGKNKKVVIIALFVPHSGVFIPPGGILS
jgi:hypothetical protein